MLIISIISALVAIGILEIYIGVRYVYAESNIWEILFYIPWTISLDCGIAALLLMK